MPYESQAADFGTNRASGNRAFVLLRSEHSVKLFVLRTIAAQIHAASAVAAVVGMLVLVRMTSDHAFSHFAAVAVFGICCTTLFVASAVTHFLDDGFHLSPRLARWLENFDKFSIYLVIASTYTAVMHPILQATTQAVILSLLWVLAALGCLYTVFIDRLPKWAQSRIVYTGQFILLGWTALLCLDEIIAALSASQLGLIFAGGGVYSIGAVGYAFQWPKLGRYFGYHEIWHLCVTGGCLLFYVLVFSLYQ